MDAGVELENESYQYGTFSQLRPGRFPRVSAACGTRYLSLIFDAPNWIHRRVDTYRFRGMGRLHQHTSLDFTIPLDPPTARGVKAVPAAGERSADSAGQALQSDRQVAPPLEDQRDEPEFACAATVFLPLMQIRKRPLIGFQLANASHEDVCLITARQSRTLSTVGLLALADGMLDLAGSESLLTDLGSRCPESVLVDYQFASASSEVETNQPNKLTPAASERRQRDLRDLQRSLIRLVALDSETGSHELGKFRDADSDSFKGELWQTKVFRFFLPLLAHAYFMTVSLADPPYNCRTVLEVDLERVLSTNRVSSSKQFGSHLQAGLENVCWAPMSVSQEAHAATTVESYHVEVEAPAGLKVVAMKWFITPPRGDSDAQPGVDKKAAAESKIIRDLGSRPVDCYPRLGADGEHSIAHSVIVPVPTGYSLIVRWRLAPLATGWLLVALLVSSLIFGVQLLYNAPRLELGGLEVGPIAWFLNSARADGTLDTDGELGRVLLQNRAALILGLVALGVTALLRSGEHPLTKRLLMAPRAAVLLLVTSFLLSGVDLFIAEPPQEDLRSLWLLLFTGASWLVLWVSWLTSVGPIRRRRQRWSNAKLARDNWEAWP